MRAAFFSFLLLFCHTLFGNFHQPDITVFVKMRDGLELPTDIYMPLSKNPPSILIRSPSGRKTPYATIYSYLKDHGYSVIIQETRSFVDKEGKTLPYSTDGAGDLQDGYDTIAWLKDSPYSNGSIGTLGTSSMGITQLFLAPTSPEGLKCQYICLATSDVFNHGLYHSGKMLEQQIKLWLKIYAKDPSCYQSIFARNEYSSFWDPFNTLLRADKVTVPAIHFGGWYDVFLKGTIDSFMAWQTRGGRGAKNQQKLIIGPWIHLWPLVNRFGDFSYPQQAHTPPYAFKPEDWFAYHLKGERNGMENLPAVTYFVMGPFDGSRSSGNVWKNADHWPPHHEPTPFYLADGNGLSPELKSPSRYSFQYDPDNPVPTLGGRNLFLASGPVDQSPLEGRKDMVLFTSEPLKEDLEITGPVTAKIYFSTDQEDSDLSVRLCDVYPDGKSILIADGIVRLSDFYKKNQFPEGIKHAINGIAVDLWPTSLVFAKGHSIRVTITSSNYPKYEKNLNIPYRSGDVPKIARNSIFTGPKYQSHLLLPVIPGKK